MKRAPWYGRWGHFLAGVFIGLLIVAPVLATPLAPPSIDAATPFSPLVDSALSQIVALLLLASAFPRRQRDRRLRDGPSYR